MKNILLLQGGGGTEHEISLISAKYIESQIDSKRFKVYSVVIDKEKQWRYEDKICELNSTRELVIEDQRIPIQAAIPVIHGYPGETGDIQSYFELISLPYFGCKPEASVLCFNKLTTKLMLESVGVKTTPFIQITNEQISKAKDFFKIHKNIYVKATNQGSSVGCYFIDDETELEKMIKEAFKFSPFVILEKSIDGRELEVSAFEFDNQLHLTQPGEIQCPSKFYDYSEKYSQQSHTKTIPRATDVSDKALNEIKRQAELAWSCLKLRHLSRIDFFLTKDDQIYINEINTFPGHTSISMFPMMMEKYGVKYSDYINQLITNISL